MYIHFWGEGNLSVAGVQDGYFVFSRKGEQEDSGTESLCGLVRGGRKEIIAQRLLYNCVKVAHVHCVCGTCNMTSRQAVRKSWLISRLLPIE